MFLWTPEQFKRKKEEKKIIKEMRYYQTYLFLQSEFNKNKMTNLKQNLLTESNLILATDINLGWKLDLSMLTVSRT